MIITVIHGVKSKDCNLDWLSALETSFVYFKTDIMFGWPSQVLIGINFMSLNRINEYYLDWNILLSVLALSIYYKHSVQAYIVKTTTFMSHWILTVHKQEPKFRAIGTTWWD